MTNYIYKRLYCCNYIFYTAHTKLYMQMKTQIFQNYYNLKDMKRAIYVKGEIKVFIIVTSRYNEKSKISQNLNKLIFLAVARCMGRQGQEEQLHPLAIVAFTHLAFNG